ncbi:hydroxyisourate hydrolase, partial [Streptomyces sp. NPDC127074]|uniref:hydroxyisourate hydrolase n=1 Tax=Streptomyces sp. NPDC127074 TaxID=3347130 RepID=UPI00364F9FD8
HAQQPPPPHQPPPRGGGGRGGGPPPPPPGGGAPAHADSLTDADGRCKDLPDLPEGTTHARLRFETGPYLTHAFFPEVAVAFAVEPGEHYHVPLLLTPFGYSVYRGS